ncbi:deleted in lung and esophageal cancer protein 1 isoform X2 [Xiphophorus maculatus]|uniref:DLEC1 cilia and flagella associated protein n=1 Tax=Xiphophorus maculatus TaxID=8083 RepID=M4A4E5_XIPMA|nr:deleted in lung and esophageal cancer protein 1 isoform X2 [Xiphophorus maculatus]
MTEDTFVEPLMDSHRPSSGTSQDISHVLMSVFKGVYNKDIIAKGNLLSNLIKTNVGKNSYHDKYVKELHQARSEYEQCIKMADMMEDHICKGKAQAAAKESRNCERMKADLVDGCDYAMFPVKSTFCWCVDDDLLKRNNLISPGDYLPAEKPQIRAPAPVKSSFAKPTISFAIRTTRESQDRGPQKTLLEMNELDDSLTCESSSEPQQSKRIPKMTIPKPTWFGQPSAKNRTEGWEQLQKFKRRQSVLLDRRVCPPNAQQCRKSFSLPKVKVKNDQEKKNSDNQSSIDELHCVFQATPQVMFFTEYSIGSVYESTLELKNMTYSSRYLRVIPPTTPYFSIGLGRFPSDEGIVAPGMSSKYTLRFAPDSLGDFKDFMMVQTESQHLFVVPIEARRPPPVLTLPRVLDCGYCLVGGVKFLEFMCQNVGLSAGTFYIIPKDQWPAPNLRSLSTTYFSEKPPFAVGPCVFSLQPGEAIVVEVVFFPTTVEHCSQPFAIICDNCQVKYISLEGDSQLVGVELVSISGENEPLTAGEMHDLTAEHFVRFSECHPHIEQQKRLVIRNNVHLELAFHWQIMKPNLRSLLPGETHEPSHIQFHPDTNDVYHMSPPSGLLAPCQEHEFLLTFCPKELKDYHSVFHLVLRDIPLMPLEPNDNSILHPVHSGSKLNNVIIMDIEVKGSTELYRVLLEPYGVIIPGEIFISIATHRQFKMWNHSKTFILFQWERLNSSSHVIDVEPSAGRIEENECFDFEVIVTGGKPDKLKTNLVCNIQHRHEPVKLPIEVSFKGPTVKLSVPCVDFGLVRLGDEVQTTLSLTNTTPLEACWMFKEKINNKQDHQDTNAVEQEVVVEPGTGVLPPFASCSVTLHLNLDFCQKFETEMELIVENGTTSPFWIQAVVQSPQVCFLNCKLVFSDLYLGVPSTGTVTLFNQTLLPSHFSWKEHLQGKQASLCTATFDPSSGILGPNATMNINVNLTSHTDLKLTEVAAICDVQGMNSPLVLQIVGSQSKKLSVSYSLPGACHIGNSDSPSALIIDFGKDVILKTEVTKQFLMTNESAIPAAFTIKPEFFTCNVSMANSLLEKRLTYLKTPLFTEQVTKVEAKAHEDFVTGLLAHGNGAAFMVQPDSGQLGPFETKTVDVTAYCLMWGEYRDHLICKVGDLEPMHITMQMTVKGCPLYFQMIGPQPDDQCQGPTMHFGTHLSGGDTISQPLRINNPTMFDIQVDWEIYNIDENDHTLIELVMSCGDHFPLKDDDGNELLKGTFRVFNENDPTQWEKNQTPTLVGTSMSLQSGTNGKEKEYEEEEHLYPAKKNFISVHTRPYIGSLSDSPYSIIPQQIVIPAKSTGCIHVSFTPFNLSESQCESRCVGVACGFLNLNSEKAVCIPGKVRRDLALDLQPVKLDLLGTIKPAVLLVQMEEDSETLEFNASAGDLLRVESDNEVVVSEFSIVESFQLRNIKETPLHFKLETQPPFSVVRPHSGVWTSISSTNGLDQPLVLYPQNSMQVKVAFHCSLSLLDLLNHTEEDLSLAGSLIHTKTGRKKLRLQQNLLIHHSNNNLQKVPLCAYLELPILSLSTDCLTFGFCDVGDRQTRKISLSCRGSNTYWKSLIKSDEGDPQVFEVAPDSGVFQSRELVRTSSSQFLQISFTPSKQKEFTALLVIESPLVKTPLTLPLLGVGSFDEDYISTYFLSGKTADDEMVFGGL